MPSGYTADIHKGITFKQFAMSCARAFGAMIAMRDEPSNAEIPESFPPSTHHRDELERLRDELGNLRAMSVVEIEQEAEAAYLASIEAHQKRVLERDELRAKYQQMLGDVNAWQPPTPDHKGLKDFMVEQITSSIDWDCSHKYDDTPTRVSAQEWIEAKLAATLQSIEYHTKGDAEEIKRTQERNDWIKSLRTSLAPALS